METREQYYTLKEVRDLLKISYITLYRWVQAGKIPAYKVGKQYRINKTDYEEFIKPVTKLLIPD